MLAQTHLHLLYLSAGGLLFCIEEGVSFYSTSIFWWALLRGGAGWSVHSTASPVASCLGLAECSASTGCRRAFLTTCVGLLVLHITAVKHCTITALAGAASWPTAWACCPWPYIPAQSATEQLLKYCTIIALAGAASWPRAWAC